MAINTWSSLASTDGNLAGNWSLGALADTDTLTLNGTSVINCTLTAAWNCTAISITAAYTGTFNDGGFGVANVSGAVTIAAGGAFTASGTWTQDADANFAFNCTGAETTTSWQIDLQGTGTCDIDKAITIAKMTWAANGKTTTVTNGAAVTFRDMAFGTGVLTSNATINYRPNTGPKTFTANTLTTMNGSGGWFIQTYGAITLTVNAITYTGTGGINFGGNSGAATINQAGTINIGANTLIINCGTGNPVTYNTQNFAITCGPLSVGSYSGAGTFTFNKGSSVLNIASFTGATYNSGTNNINLSTSTITCAGSWTNGSTHTVNPGTSLVTFTGNSTITPAGESFYDLTINAPAATVATTGDLTLAAGGDLTLTAGTLNISGDDVIIGGNMSLAAGATFTIDATSTLAFTGAATIATGGKTLPQTTLNGATAINAGCTITRLVYGTDGITVTWQAGETWTITNLLAANWNGALGSLNAMRSSTPGTQYTLAIPNAVTLEYMNPQDSIASGFDITVDDGTSTDGGNNTGWVFPAVASSVRHHSKLAIAIGIGIGL